MWLRIGDVVKMLNGLVIYFFFQAEDGIRDLVRSRGLGDVYKRQGQARARHPTGHENQMGRRPRASRAGQAGRQRPGGCLLYTSDAADERSSVDLGGRRIIKKKTQTNNDEECYTYNTTKQSTLNYSEEHMLCIRYVSHHKDT